MTAAAYHLVLLACLQGSPACVAVAPNVPPFETAAACRGAGELARRGALPAAPELPEGWQYHAFGCADEDTFKKLMNDRDGDI